MYKGLHTLGQEVHDKIGYAGQSMIESTKVGYEADHEPDDHEIGYTGMEDEKMKDAYGTERAKSGYKTIDKEQKEKKEESEFDKLVEREAEKTKKETKVEPQKKTPVEDFTRNIDLNKVKEELTKKPTKEDKAKKELEEAVKREQIERV